METKIICLIKQDLNEHVNKNKKGDLSRIVSMNFSNKLILKDWNWRTPITDFLSLDKSKQDYKKN